MMAVDLHTIVRADIKYLLQFSILLGVSLQRAAATCPAPSPRHPPWRAWPRDRRGLDAHLTPGAVSKTIVSLVFVMVHRGVRRSVTLNFGILPFRSFFLACVASEHFAYNQPLPYVSDLPCSKGPCNPPKASRISQKSVKIRCSREMSHVIPAAVVASLTMLSATVT